jgi:uncharacterized tellurite resistance protein B-like protein
VESRLRYGSAVFGFFQKRTAREPSAADALVEQVRDVLPGTDAETIEIVVAIAGLLAAIAYADRRYSLEEDRRVREELGRLHGMTAAGVDAICTVLAEHARELSTVGVPAFCRSLVELGDRELRVEVLGMLVELAAADGVIDTPESNLLRLATRALGLSQDDYNAAQAAHRAKLGVLSR